MLFTQSPGAWCRWLGCIALAGLPLLAGAQSQDPPDRVLYISAQQGSGRLSTDGMQWSATGPNWPVVTGAQLSTDPGARLELDGGNVVIRTTGPSDLGVTQLNDQTTQLSLTDGSLSLRVRGLQPGERVEIDTPQLALVADQAGDYRIDVNPRSDSSRVSVLSGMATVYGEGGQVTNIGGPQMMAFAGRGLSVVARGGLPARDGFDQWIVTRENQWRGSVSAQYVSPAMPGVGLLDQYGEWGQDPTYGAVWYPQVTAVDWAPYRYGRWSWVEPWGWTWVDDAPWGFAPSHYGRWAQIGPRWAWVPGPRIPRPVYAPALVGFVGAVGGAGWGISVGSALPGAAWFPLAPGEVWQPHYRVSGGTMQRLNPWVNGRAPMRAPDSYYFQRRPTAVSFAPPDRFGGSASGRGPDRGPRFTDGTRLPPGALDGARPIAPPPRGFASGRGAPPMVAAPSDRPLPDMRPPVIGHGPGPHAPGPSGSVSVPALPPGMPRPGRPDAPFHGHVPAAPVTSSPAQQPPRGPIPVSPPNAELPHAPVYPARNPGQVAPPAKPPHRDPRPNPRDPLAEHPRPQPDAPTPPPMTRPTPHRQPQMAPLPPIERPVHPSIERPSRPPMEQPTPHMAPPQRVEPPPMPQHRAPQPMPQPPQQPMRPQPMPHGQMEGPRMPPPQREMREPVQRPQAQPHERPPQREGRPQREER